MVLSIKSKFFSSITIKISKKTSNLVKDPGVFIVKRNYGILRSPSSNRWPTCKRIKFLMDTWLQRTFLLQRDPMLYTNCSVSIGGNPRKRPITRFYQRRWQPSIFLLMSSMSWRESVWSPSTIQENLMSIQWECYCFKLQLLNQWQIVMTFNVLQ